MRISASALILSVGLLLVSCNRYSLPRIKEPEALRRDCAALAVEFPSGVSRTNSHGQSFRTHGLPIPKEKWATSILSLKPFNVTSEKYGVCIWILFAEKDNLKGYYVFTDANLAPPSSSPSVRVDEGVRCYFKKTNFKGIYEFLEPSIIF